MFTFWTVCWSPASYRCSCSQPQTAEAPDQALIGGGVSHIPQFFEWGQAMLFAWIKFYRWICQMRCIQACSIATRIVWRASQTPTGSYRPRVTLSVLRWRTPLLGTRGTLCSHERKGKGVWKTSSVVYGRSLDAAAAAICHKSYFILQPVTSSNVNPTYVPHGTFDDNFAKNSTFPAMTASSLSRRFFRGVWM